MSRQRAVELLNCGLLRLILNVVEDLIYGTGAVEGAAAGAALGEFEIEQVVYAGRSLGECVQQGVAFGDSEELELRGRHALPALDDAAKRYGRPSHLDFACLKLLAFKVDAGVNLGFVFRQ